MTLICVLLPPISLVPETEVLVPVKLWFNTKLPVTERAPKLLVVLSVKVPVPSAAVRLRAVVRPVTEPPNVTLLLVVVSVTRSAASVAFPV